jgi:hypothetical protein
MQETAIKSLHMLLAVIQELIRSTNLSLSFSRRDFASEFAGALCKLSEQVDTRAGASSGAVCTTFAQVSAGLISVIREAKNPALDLARALEAGLFQSVLKCWIQLCSLNRKVLLDQLFLFVVDFLPVSCVSRALAAKPFGELLDQAIGESDEQDKWAWGDILLGITQKKFPSEGSTKMEVQLCSNLMVSTFTSTLLSMKH